MYIHRTVDFNMYIKFFENSYLKILYLSMFILMGKQDYS